MPYRKTILATDKIYHVLNQSRHGLHVFKHKTEISIFLEAAWYYLNYNPPVKFSTYRKSRNQYKISLDRVLVKILAYCLMPNHFHFILLQNFKDGIKTYIQRITNSYSHYFNTKHEQKGPLFKGPFKAVRVKTDEQLLHLSRYIHLNPVTDYLVEHSKNYPFSSYQSYMGKESLLPIQSKFILSHFSNSQEYQRFLLSRKDYLSQLAKIKHLLLE